MMNSYITPAHRIFSLLIYALALISFQGIIFDLTLLPNEKAIWMYSGIFSLLISSRLTNPYFTPPLDALINSFAILVTCLSMFLVQSITLHDEFLIKVLLIYPVLILLASLVTLLGRNFHKGHVPNWLSIIDKLSRTLGDGNVIFTLVILVSVYLFHREDYFEVYSILTAWIFISFKPIENFLGFINWSKKNHHLSDILYVGEVAAYQLPGLILIKVISGAGEKIKKVSLIYDQEGRGHLGIALGMVGRDDGVLIKALMLPIPTNVLIQNRNIAKSLSTNAVFSFSLSDNDIQSIPDPEASSIIKYLDRITGIVDQDTSTSILQFEVINDYNLAEGRLVETKIGNRDVLYQVIDGLTKEDVIQQKEKYGYARAKARKIGLWDEENKKFVPVSWLPKINSPVMLANNEEFTITKDAVGHFPQTNYHTGINISDAVTHNTAILGILGIGKSCLSIELVERMVADSIKVICLDLTNQYKNELSDLIDAQYIEDKVKALTQSSPGASNTNRDEGGNRKAFRTTLKTVLQEFIDSQDKHILILNPSEFNVWKQSREKYKDADPTPLELASAAEITAYVSEAALTIMQAKGMTDQARLCLVYEEAHSLIPEWNSIAQDGDKYATALTSRAILQGRKFGMGCLLITQRTANVTKTILNQCNTIFAMRTFDDTGKEFLSNYIGGEYAASLANLQARHAVFYGKASTCENPVLIRLNDRDAFIKAFRNNPTSDLNPDI